MLSALAVLCGAAALGSRLGRGRSHRDPGHPFDASTPPAARRRSPSSGTDGPERPSLQHRAAGPRRLRTDRRQVRPGGGRSGPGRLHRPCRARTAHAGAALPVPGRRVPGGGRRAGGAVSARWAVERILRTIEQHDWSAIAEGLAVTASAGLATCGRGELRHPAAVARRRRAPPMKNAGRNRLWVGRTPPRLHSPAACGRPSASGG